MRKALLLAATTALVAGMTSSASAETFTATALIQQNNGNCGNYVEGQPVIGSAKFSRFANKLKVTYKAKHLAKSETYELEFWNASPCEFLGSTGTFVTTGTGVGSVIGEREVPEKDVEFFVDAVSTRGGSPFTNDSFIVTLPKP